MASDVQKLFISRRNEKSIFVSYHVKNNSISRNFRNSLNIANSNKILKFVYIRNLLFCICKICSDLWFSGSANIYKLYICIGRTKTFYLSAKRKIYFCKLSRKEQFHKKKSLPFNQYRELEQDSEICICGVYIHCNHDTHEITYIFWNIDISNDDRLTEN